ncbi:MAG: hypothetical protein KKH70_03100 [Gammaproteobacteria bacterium]|nr:hypothetical protein [Gammaproteobacteria bacterium]
MNPQTTSFGNEYSRTMIAGLVGGTVSAVTGGKFANGAVTSAMQWWFNAEGAGEIEKVKSWAKQYRDRIASLDPKTVMDRVSLAAHGVELGFFKSLDHASLLISSISAAGNYKNYMLDHLNDIYRPEALAFAAEMASGGATLGSNDKGGNLAQLASPMLQNSLYSRSAGLYAAAIGSYSNANSFLKFNEFMSPSQALSLNLGQIENEAGRYYVNNCGRLGCF